MLTVWNCYTYQAGLKLMELVRIWGDRHLMAHNAFLVLKSANSSNFQKLRSQYHRYDTTV